MFKIKFIYLFFIFMYFITITGCGYIKNNFGITSVAGYYISEDKLDKIVIGITQKEIFELLGSPSFTSTFNKDIWYYVYQKTWYIAIFKEKLIEQQILILQFNKDGTLIDKQLKDIKDSKNIKFDNTNTKFLYKKCYLKPDLFPCTK